MNARRKTYRGFSRMNADQEPLPQRARRDAEFDTKN
jgi:hypothetical protein